MTGNWKLTENWKLIAVVLMLVLGSLGVYYSSSEPGFFLGGFLPSQFATDSDGLQSQVNFVQPGSPILVETNENTYGSCSAGAIVQREGDYDSDYILTARHCAKRRPEEDNDNVIGRDIYQRRVGEEGVIMEEEKIGEISHASNEVDAALIKLDDDVTYTNKVPGGYISGFADADESPSEFKDGMKVFKLGKSTGLTYGEIVEETWDIVNVQKDKGVFSEQGDSGAVIITESRPYRIVGLVSGHMHSMEGTISPSSSDIKDSLDIVIRRKVTKWGVLDDG